MKKGLLVLLFSGILALGGCQTKEDAEKARLIEAFENMGAEHSEVIKAVLAKEWNVADSEESYIFTMEGTGEISGESFTYTCGFDEKNEIVLQIVMDDTKEERKYFVSTDDTGYGLHLDAPGEEDIYLLQANMEFFGADDERAAGVFGEWADKSNNHYFLNEDRTMLIKNKSGVETEGTYSLAENRDNEGKLLLTLVFDGNTLDFNYTVSGDGTTLTLSTPEASHILDESIVTEREQETDEMKIMIASDIHGSAYYCAKLLEARKRECPEKLLLLGDILYHGPRNDLPRAYEPKKVITMLNEISSEILCVRGNCEAEVDQMVLDFPVLADYCILYEAERMIFATHGHVYNENNVPPLKKGDILLHGHTHIPACNVHENYTYINPGSVSIPKNGSEHGYLMLEDGVFTWKTLDGEIYRTYRMNQ